MLALAWLGAAAAAPRLVRVLGRTDLCVGEVLAVETAGTGERLLALAGEDMSRLAQYQRWLGRGDHGYVAFYASGLALGVLQLGGTARALAAGVVAGTVVADIIENEALEAALGALCDDPATPTRADAAAALARVSALVKFALLVPALGAALTGVARGLRSGGG